MTLFELDGYWTRVKDGDERLAAIYFRHYSCHQYKDNRRQCGYRNRFLVMGPGEKMPLLATDGRAIFGWRKFKDASGQVGINCAFFRNEGDALSSLMILDAERHAWKRWPGERLYTYVNADAVQSRNPGYCFIKAGWRKCGHTKGGLIVLEKLIEVTP